jgi:UDP-N-acetylmuramate--alanine ligase
MITTRFRGLHIHLMGIGGAGVSALVPLLRKAGAVISGCDAGENATTRRLRREGVPIAIGHAQAHAEQADVLVHTAAVGVDHPEIAAARRRGIAVLTRGACLVQLMLGTRTLAVAGSHGKSSTTWFLGHLLVEAGEDPVVMVGGGVASLGQGGARAGGGELFVAETDESDGSFAEVLPEVAIVTNLDLEHLRHYGSFAALEEAFNVWLRRIPAGGAAIVPTAGLSARVTAGLRCPVLRCGLDAGDWHVTELELGPEGSRCRVIADGHDIGELVVPIPGAHMVSNALMALAAARRVSPRSDPASLARCERVDRRFTVHGIARGVRVVEDYGHHPTEVRATIAAARLGGGRVHVIFQPHRYSRTADCFVDFAVAFDQAHTVALLPIYAASEEPIAGVTSARLAEAIAARRAGLGEDPGLVVAHDEGAEAAAFIARHVQPGDTCLVLGAGDVGRWAKPLLHVLETPSGDSSATALLACRGDAW